MVFHKAGVGMNQLPSYHSAQQALTGRKKLAVLKLLNHYLAAAETPPHDHTTR